MLRMITGAVVMLGLTSAVGVQPAAAQSEVECARYALQSCLSPNWQNQGYSSNAACRNAYFNHCYYGDPLEPLSYKPDARKLDDPAKKHVKKQSSRTV